MARSKQQNKGMKAGCKPHGRTEHTSRLVHKPAYREGYARGLTVTKPEDINGNVYQHNTVSRPARPEISTANVSAFNMPRPPSGKRKAKRI